MLNSIITPFLIVRIFLRFAYWFNVYNILIMMTVTLFISYESFTPHDTVAVEHIYGTIVFQLMFCMGNLWNMVLIVENMNFSTNISQ